MPATASETHTVADLVVDGLHGFHRSKKEAAACVALRTTFDFEHRDGCAGRMAEHIRKHARAEETAGPGGAGVVVGFHPIGRIERANALVRWCMAEHAPAARAEQTAQPAPEHGLSHAVYGCVSALIGATREQWKECVAGGMPGSGQCPRRSIGPNLQRKRMAQRGQ